MRAYELLREGNEYTNQVESSVNDLLADLKANGISEIETSKLCQQLNNTGLNADPASLLPTLQSNPYVQSADENMVTLGDKEAQDGSGSNDSGKSDKEIVSDLAQKAVN